MTSARRNKLFEAAIEGNVETLLELLQQDPLLLDRVDNNNNNSSSGDTPLHVAALRGHVTFVDEILNRRPELAKEPDAAGSSALHVAASKGFVEIVKLFVQIDSDLCLLRDGDGRSPLQVAAVRGRVHVLAEIVRGRPETARTAVDGGGTVLHLCVKYNQLEGVQMLIECVDDDDGLVNAKDDYGFTVLHLAVSHKHLPIVEYLINNTGIKVNALTTNGFTALDILIQSHRDLKDMAISQALTAAGAIQTTTTKKNNPQPHPSSSFSSFHYNLKASLIIRRVISAIFDNKTESWILRKQEALLVGASLIATMAFQAGMNPPGGVWQADDPAMNRTAGTSVLAEKHLKLYNKFLAFNTTGFTASLIVILMLITGLTNRHLIFVRILIVAMWVAVCSMAYTYGYSIRFFTPKEFDAIIFRMSVVVALVVSASFILFFLEKLFFILTHHEHKVNARSRKPSINQLP